VFDIDLDLLVAKRTVEVSLKHRKAKLRRHLSKCETARIAQEVDAYKEKNRHLAQQGMPDWINLARDLMRAEIEALERSLERDVGDFTGMPRDPLVKSSYIDRHGQTETVAFGESIAEALEAFKRENPCHLSKSRMEVYWRDISIFIDIVGPTFPVSKLRKKHVREWKALFME
jgi:hypothetical protein